jgi:hypothetical protein
VQTDAFHEKYLNQPGCRDYYGDDKYCGYRNDRDHLDYHDNLTLAFQNNSSSWLSLFLCFSW